MSKLQKITEVDIATVGEFYLVPCVKVPAPIMGFNSGNFVPVIGDCHTDPEISFPELHFHYDLRFVKQIIRASVVVALRSYSPFSYFPSRDEPIVWRKKKCYRNQVEFPRSFCAQLEPLYRHGRLKNNICPHKGANLSGCAPDEYGRVICPLHGLRWDKATGEMVSRLEEVVT